MGVLSPLSFNFSLHRASAERAGVRDLTNGARAHVGGPEFNCAGRANGPASKDGRVIGFKIFSIRPGSVYSQIGVQNGDVVRRINGYELNDPMKLLELVPTLTRANRVEVELERNGSPMTKKYNVR